MFSNFFKRPSIYIFIFSHLWIVVSTWSWLSNTPEKGFDHEKLVDLPSITTTTQSSTPTTTMTSSTTLFTTESVKATTDSNTESPMDNKSSQSTTQAVKISTTTESPETGDGSLDHDDHYDDSPSNKGDESRSQGSTIKSILSNTNAPFATTTVTKQPSAITTTKSTPTTTLPSTTTTSTTTSTTTINPDTQDPISSSANSKDKRNEPFPGFDNNDTDSGTGIDKPSDFGKSNINDSIATPTLLQGNESSVITVTETKDETHSNDSNVSHNETTPEYENSRDQRGIGKEDGTKSTETVTTDSTSAIESVTIKVNTTTSLIPSTGQSIVAIDSIARRVNTSSANSIGSYQFLSILLFSLLITQISL